MRAGPSYPNNVASFQMELTDEEARRLFDEIDEIENGGPSSSPTLSWLYDAIWHHLKA